MSQSPYSLYTYIPYSDSSICHKAKRNRDSAGSAPRGSSNSTQKLFIYIDHFLADNSSTIIYAGMIPLEREISTLPDNFFESIPEIQNEQLRILCDLTSSVVTDEWNQYLLPYEKEDNEASLQTYLTKNCNLFGAIDTHNPPEKAVEFIDFNDETVFSRTARAGLTSQLRRQVFEVKSNNCDGELIQLIMERVVVSMDMCHVLKNSIAFGATPSSAFVCIGTRKIPFDRKSRNTKNIHIFRVPHNKVCAMWMLASHNIHGPESYLTEDGPLVLHGLKALGIDPWCCRIHLSWWSQNRVYEITLPEVFDFPKSFQKSKNENASASQCFGVDSKNSTFSLKVIRDTDKFDRECEALKVVDPSFFIGGYRFVSREVTEKKNIPTTASFHLDPNGWWGKTITEYNCPSEGGVLVMSIGEQLHREILTVKESQQVFSDCLRCLTALDEKGYSHTDVRLANIVKFGNTYQVVDFGEVVKHTDNLSVPWDDFSPSRKELVRYDPEEKWTIMHDIEMLVNALFYNLIDNKEA